MFVRIGLSLVFRAFLEVLSMQGRQWLILIRLSPPKFCVPVKFDRSNNVQKCIFGLHESVNMTDADLVKILDRSLIILMVFPMVLFVVIHEEGIEALAECEVF